jgi:sulfite reductase beta subunit-like hemoprotein
VHASAEPASFGPFAPAAPATEPSTVGDALHEIDMWEAEMRRFLAGELPAERWRSFRLIHGSTARGRMACRWSASRSPGRVDFRASSASLGGDRGRSLHGKAHITTRQDVQLYFIALERVPDLMRRLAVAGLTTREACGNSVRNVTACPLTGVLADELFDVQPYAAATYAFLVRNPFCQQMARKFKIAFSSCPEDCAATAIHDIGLLGRIEDAGELRREGLGSPSSGALPSAEGSSPADDRPPARLGFKVLVGGGLGPTPYVARTLEEHVPLDELLPTIKAILQVYADLGNRRSKAKRTPEVCVAKIGIDDFRRRVRRSRARASHGGRSRKRRSSPSPDAAAAAGRAPSRGAVDRVVGRVRLCICRRSARRRAA